VLHQNGYTITMKVNDHDFDLSPSEFSFVIHDSIYEMFPTLTLYLMDSSGMLQELLFGVIGTKLKITYGYDSKVMSATFKVLSDSTRGMLSQSSVAGMIQLDLVHEWYFDQEKQSNGYHDRISSIVREIAESYSFTQMRINDTGNYEYWYQPNVSQFEFIENFLMPFSYSDKSNNTPFYCFIDNNNHFNYRHYKDLFSQKEITSLHLMDDSQESASGNAITSFLRTRLDYESLQSALKRNFYEIDDTGNLQMYEADITEVPALKKKIFSIPIIDDLQLVRGKVHLPENLNDEDRIGFITNSLADVVNLEKGTVDLSFNPMLKAGQKVMLNIPSAQDLEHQESSLYHSGEYIIEECFQKWSKDSDSGSTSLILGRQGGKAPASQFKLKRMLIQ